MHIFRAPCRSELRASQRGVAGRSPKLIAVAPKRLNGCNAVRREIEPVSFVDVYMAMQERVATQGTLPKGDGRLMVESIRTIEHAQRSLQLIAAHVANKRKMAGALELDWPLRKKWLARICDHALRIPNAKPLILDIFANAEVFGLSTYFAAEMVEVLAKQGAELGLLTRVVELFRSRRPAGDKGVAAAYHRLLAILKERKDEEATKMASAALKSYLKESAPQPAEPAAPAPAPAPAAPAAAAASAPAVSAASPSS